ncbi:P-loop containing nucleoside triphosphate hydrolase protein [Infundibulicybe gibba]|nr:P-loop containing nucleoside triphosphate hydrolase protein [Infundibulicybe gibba]
MLLGHLRVSPPPPPPMGMFPFLSHSDPHKSIAMVSFGNRSRGSGGAFYDYTARYGAVREEDRVTLRQSMFPETIPPEDSPLITAETSQGAKPLSEHDQRFFDSLIQRMGLQEFLDLPLIALSNGQTRRARIVKAILSRPELLLLDEPLTGLDVQNRPAVLDLLHQLHSSRSPRVIIGLRVQDPVPDWITHIALAQNGGVLTGPKEQVMARLEQELVVRVNGGKGVPPSIPVGAVLVDLQNVGVKYGERTVLKNLNWQIRQGERWHLRGTNGSGKTTLLSLLTGDHPQSYTQAHLHLHGRPRGQIPTPHLHSLIGLLALVLGSCPLDDAAVRWRVQRCWEVLEALGPRAWGGDAMRRKQRMVLLMRALVGKPPLVLLDEVWSGMDDGMVRAARDYLRNGGVGNDQGVVVITHWEEEVPWGPEDGVKRFQLEDGLGNILY